MRIHEGEKERKKRRQKKKKKEEEEEESKKKKRRKASIIYAGPHTSKHTSKHTRTYTHTYQETRRNSITSGNHCDRVFVRCPGLYDRILTVHLAFSQVPSDSRKKGGRRWTGPRKKGNRREPRGRKR